MLPADEGRTVDRSQCWRPISCILRLAMLAVDFKVELRRKRRNRLQRSTTLPAIIVRGGLIIMLIGISKRKVRSASGVPLSRPELGAKYSAHAPARCQPAGVSDSVSAAPDSSTPYGAVLDRFFCVTNDEYRLCCHVDPPPRANRFNEHIVCSFDTSHRLGHRPLASLSIRDDGIARIVSPSGSRMKTRSQRAHRQWLHGRAVASIAPMRDELPGVEQATYRKSAPAGRWESEATE